MSRSNKHGQGFPVDPVSGEAIGQSGLYQIDGNGNFQPVSAGSPLFSMDFVMSVRRGLVPGWITDRKWGDAPLVGTTQQPLWPSAQEYKFLTAGEIFNISSLSTEDDDGGLGAQAYQFVGIRSDTGKMGSEIVVANGQDDAPTANEYFNCHRLRVVAAGAGGAAIVGIEDAGGATGLVSATSDTTSKLQALILPGNNVTTQVVFRVPVNEEWIFLNSAASVSSGKTLDFKTYVRVPPATVFEKAGETDYFENLSTQEFETIPLAGGSEFIFLVKSSASGTEVSAALEFMRHKTDGSTDFV